MDLFIVWIIIIIALFFTVRYVYRSFTGKSKCAGCSDCCKCGDFKSDSVDCLKKNGDNDLV